MNEQRIKDYWQRYHDVRFKNEQSSEHQQRVATGQATDRNAHIDAQIETVKTLFPNMPDCNSFLVRAYDDGVAIADGDWNQYQIEFNKYLDLLNSIDQISEYVAQNNFATYQQRFAELIDAWMRDSVATKNQIIEELKNLPSAPPADELNIETSFTNPLDLRPSPQQNLENNQQNTSAGSSTQINFLSLPCITAIKTYLASSSHKNYTFTDIKTDKDGNQYAKLTPKDPKNKDEKPIYIYKDRLTTEINSIDEKLTAQEEQRLKIMAGAVMTAKEAVINNIPGLSEEEKKIRRTVWIGSSNPAAIKFWTEYYTKATPQYTIVPKPTPTSSQSKTPDQNSHEILDDLKYPSIRQKSAKL